MPISLNVEPYYDDFDPSKGYHKILFVPGRPIQARELTQIQSILQHQLKQNADYIFKNGSMVVPGDINFINNANYIKLKLIHNNISTDTIIDSLLTKRIVGTDTQVKATVIHVEQSTDNDYPTIFIMYTAGGIDQDGNFFKTFNKNETLYLEDDTEVQVKIIDESTYKGYGSLASITEGVYYINGFFVQNLSQTISLDKYSNYPSYRVGLNFVENIVTSAIDPSLKDIAIDSSNYGAAGADRYQIQLELTKNILLEDQIDNTTSDQFIDLLHVKNGTQQFKVNSTRLGDLEKVLARRTYDESGDYVVEPFKIDLIDFRNNDRGEWVTNRVYLEGDIVSYNDVFFTAKNSGTSGATAPTTDEFFTPSSDGNITWETTRKPNFNFGYEAPTDEQTIETQLDYAALAVYKINSGKAYIKGYEIAVNGYKIAFFDKARTYKNIENVNINSDMGQYFIVNGAQNLPNFQGITPNFYPYLELLGEAGLIGQCYVRNIEYESGIIGYHDCKYRLYVVSIMMNDGYGISDVRFLQENGGTALYYVVGDDVLLSGSVQSYGSTTLSGQSTLFTSELVSGDYISVDNRTYRVSTVLNSSTLTIGDLGSGFIPNNGEWYSIYVKRTVLHGTVDLLKKLDHSFVRSVRGADDLSIDISYYVNRMFSIVSVGSPVTITLSRPFETFADLVVGNYLFVNSSGLNYPLSINDGVTFSKSPDSTELTLTGLATGSYYLKAIIRKEKQAAKEKQKIRSIAHTDYTKLNDVIGSNNILATWSGGSKLIGVYQCTDKFDFNTPDAVVTVTTPFNIDVTDNYRCVSNSSASTLSYSTISPVQGFIPSGPIRIIFEKFDTTGAGDYYSIDSYNEFTYSELPVYNNASIGDYLDFRPYDPYDYSLYQTEPLSSKYPINLSYSYYLPRRDIIQLDTTGSFRVEQGTPSDTPIAPLPNDDNVILAYASLAPYTVKVNSNNINIEVADLKRYTMKDIGKIDSRVKNAEYYISLTSLEIATSNMQIKDENGLNRYKNGFIVDQFKDHGVGDVANPSYRCAIDAGNLECRPTFYADSVKLIESLTSSRASKGYQVTGDLVTLPYTEVVAIKQNIASSGESITPYVYIRSMHGDLNIFPVGDTWVDTTTVPSVTTKSEGNFNSVQTIAQSTGILGTVWNSWQTTARTTLNTNLSSSTSSNVAGVASSTQNIGGVVNRTTTTTTTATTLTTTQTGTDQLNWSRTGVYSEMQERWDTVGQVTNVIDELWSPWMREKCVVLYSKKMMPNVRLSVFIENTPLTSYASAATTLYYTSKNGTFLDYISSNIDHQDLTARQYGSHSYDILERGEVIKGTTSGATAITICEERQFVTATEDVLKIINIKGTFIKGETIVGQSSKATLVFDKIVTESTIKTNSAGNFYGIVTIPNNSTVRVPAGILTISLRDADTQDAITTNSEAKYDGHGIIQVKQTTIMTVRNGTIVSRDVSDTKQTTENWSKIVGAVTTNSQSSTYSDVAIPPPPPPPTPAPTPPRVITKIVYVTPAPTRAPAPTEAPRTNTGCYGCGLPALFIAYRPFTPIGLDPIAQSFQVSDVGGIFVTAVDVYFHTVDLNSTASIFLQIREMVNGYPGPMIVPFGALTKMPRELRGSSRALAPSKFTFPSPVYLKDGVEYCIVMGSDQSDSKVWIAKMGEAGLDGQIITKQPAAGSFFRSQNNSTWDTDQLTDMCFTLYKAKFDTANTGVFTFKNNNTETSMLGINPFKLTSGSKIVRVTHQNHGFINGASVTFSNVITNLTHPSQTELNSKFTVSNVELDTYTITLPVAAVTSGHYGNKECIATSDRRMDTMYFNGADFVLPGTHIQYTFNSSALVNNSIEVQPDEIPIQINQNVTFENPQFILSKENEDIFTKESSFKLKAYILSKNENLSPVIDLPSYAVYTIGNKINNPSPTINLDVDKRYIINLTTSGYYGSTITLLDDTITITGGIVGDLADNFNTLKVGRYLLLNNTTVGSISPMMITKVYTDGTTTLTITVDGILPTASVPTPLGSVPVSIQVYDHYVDFIASDGSSNLSNYVTSIVELAQPSTGFRLFFDYNKPKDAFIDVYYKIAIKSDYTNIEKLPWIKLEDDVYQDVEKYDTFIEHEYDMNNIVNKYNTEVQYDQITVKVVFRSNNTSKVPRIKNFRLIALA